MITRSPIVTRQQRALNKIFEEEKDESSQINQNQSNSDMTDNNDILVVVMLVKMNCDV